MRLLLLLAMLVLSGCCPQPCCKVASQESWLLGEKETPKAASVDEALSWGTPLDELVLINTEYNEGVLSSQFPHYPDGETLVLKIDDSVDPWLFEIRR